MALFGLDTGFKNGRKKLAIVSVSVTGTGAVTTGLSSIDTGGALTQVQNGETTITATGPSWISSLSGGTVNAVVAQLAAAANTISAVAKNVGVWAVGQ